VNYRLALPPDYVAPDQKDCARHDQTQAILHRFLHTVIRKPLITAIKTNDREKHIDQIVKAITPALKAKYVKGVKAHGGKLWEKNIGPEIEGELLDLIVYVCTYEEQVKRLVEAASEMLMGPIGWEALYDNLETALAPFLTNTKHTK
jgi:hypothetical protein